MSPRHYTSIHFYSCPPHLPACSNFNFSPVTGIDYCRQRSHWQLLELSIFPQSLADSQLWKCEIYLFGNQNKEAGIRLTCCLSRRFDYEGLDPRVAFYLMRDLEAIILDKAFMSQRFAVGDHVYGVEKSENFEYVDPVDGNVARNQVSVNVVLTQHWLSIANLTTGVKCCSCSTILCLIDV